MEPLHPQDGNSPSHQPGEADVASVDAEPVGDQHSGVARVGVAQEPAIPVVQALVDAWTAEMLDVSSLQDELQSYLARNAFLRLSCRPSGFCVDGVDMPQTSTAKRLAAQLHADEVVELLFKDGIEGHEIENLLRILRQPQLHRVGFDNLATRLWEADFSKLAFRCADEQPVNHAREVEIFDLENTGREEEEEVAGARVADPREDTVISAVDALDDFPRVEVDQLPIHLKRALFLSPEDVLATEALNVPSPEESLNHLVYRLVDVYSSETDETLRRDARELLVGTIAALLRERRMAQVHELLLWLRSQVDDGATAWDELIHIVQECICAPQTVLLLGNVLNNPDSPSEDVEAVRELLLIFDERTVDPLCRVLEKLESMEARKLVCQVLAVVAAEDPAGLAHRADGQPWYVARNLAYVLGRIGSEEVLPYLRQWVLHRDERVRVEVARALGKIQFAESTEILCALLNDEEYRVRQSAVWALSKRSDPVALGHLRHLLFEDREFRERPVEERDDYFRTYGRLVQDGSFQELLDIAQQRQILSRGWKVELRRGAMIALAETGRAEARAILQKNSDKGNPRLREAAKSALRDLRNHGREAGVHLPGMARQAAQETETIAWEELGE